MVGTTTNRRSGGFNDAISTSSSTLVNPDVEEDSRRKNLPGFSLDGSRFFNTKYHDAGLKRATSERRSGRQARVSVSPRMAPNRRKIEYPDDHRCSDQDLGSGMCDCTRDGSNDSSSSTSVDDELTRSRRKMRKDDQEEAENGLGTYDLRIMEARRKKLLKDSTSWSSPYTSFSTKGADLSVETAKMGAPSPSKLSNRDLQSDPVLAPRRRVSKSISPHPEGGSSSENEAFVGKIDRLWASSPGLPHNRGDSNSAVALNGSDYKSEKFADDDVGIPPMHRSHSEEKVRTKTSPSSAPRKSIDTFYQKLFEEERQRQAELRQKKEMARERRRQELKKRQSQWPDPSLQKEIVEDGSKEREEGQCGDERFVSERVTPDEESQESCRIAPKPSPIKPSAEAYKARLLALRSTSTSSPNRSSEMTKVSPFPNLANFNRETKIETEDAITSGPDCLGHGPLQSTPPRLGRAPRISTKEIESSSKMTVPETQLVDSDKSIRATLKQLNITIQEAMQMKASPERQERQGISPAEKGKDEIKEIVEMISESKRMMEIAQLDQMYEEKLQDVRKRIDALTKIEPSRKKISTSSSSKVLKSMIFLAKFGFVLLTLLILMYAAEARARYIYLTVYHDQFQPSSLFSLPPISMQAFLRPLWVDWVQTKSFSNTRMTILNGNDTSNYLANDSNLYSYTGSIVKGSKWTVGLQSILEKAILFFQDDLYDSLYTCTFSPT